MLRGQSIKPGLRCFTLSMWGRSSGAPAGSPNQTRGLRSCLSLEEPRMLVSQGSFLPHSQRSSVRAGQVAADNRWGVQGRRNVPGAR